MFTTSVSPLLWQCCMRHPPVSLTIRAGLIQRNTRPLCAFSLVHSRDRQTNTAPTLKQLKTLVHALAILAINTDCVTHFFLDPWQKNQQSIVLYVRLARHNVSDYVAIFGYTKQKNERSCARQKRRKPSIRCKKGVC